MIHKLFSPHANTAVRLFAGCLTTVVLIGCASKLPPQLTEDLPTAPSIQQAQTQTVANIGQTVRWGGVIVATEPAGSNTRIRIVALALDGNGRPIDQDQSLGRFIAEIDGFLEPVTYAKDRLITVSGTLQGLRNDKIGEFDYRYPVVKADFHHLWPKRVPRPIDPYPYYPYHWPYRPWFHPLYNPNPYAPTSPYF